MIYHEEFTGEYEISSDDGSYDMNPQVDNAKIEPTIMECSYCKISNPKCLVKCLECKRHYCSFVVSNWSHIILHMSRSGHTGIELAEFGPSLKIQCLICYSKNIFDLGYIQSVNGKCSNLLCRGCFISIPKAHMIHKKWKIFDWESYVRSRCLNIDYPSDKDIRDSMHISISRIFRIEEMNLLGDDELDDIEMNVKSKYIDGLEYAETYHSLVLHEAQYEKDLCNHFSNSGIRIEFERYGKMLYGIFSLNGKESGISLHRN
jgi:regulator of nonsense transcripts 1